MKLFSGGRSELIGAPHSFNLLKEVTKATTIRLAVAFAHDSGWKMLKPSIDQSNADLFLLAGGSFFHTEPRVLRAWMRHPRTEAKLYLTRDLTFHPKVFIVDGPRPFAIVGSGNLSRGGLKTNVECGVYLDTPAQLDELNKWFDQIFDDAQSLATVIADYEQKWKSLRQVARDLTAKQQGLEEDILNTAEATMARWSDALSSAREFREKPSFKSLYKDRKNAGKHIRECLHFPDFDFSLDEWRAFYAIPQLGHLIPILRDGIFKKRSLLQKGLQQLIVNSGSENILEALLSKDGKFRIRGLGINIISKLLAVYAPERFAVYNKPVEETLRSFGYVPPQGPSKAGKYLAYNRMMNKFKEETGLKDAYALDVFFYHYAQGLKENTK